MRALNGLLMSSDGRGVSGSAIKVVAMAGVLTAILGLAGCSSAPLPTSIRTPSPVTQSTSVAVETSSQQILAQGAQLYAAKCQICHGNQEGQGGLGAPPHNDTGHTWHHPDGQIEDWILNGKFPGAMPPFKDVLTVEEIDTILSYLKTWWTVEQMESQADISRRYQEAFEKQGQSP